jgi:hypothetical protein
MLFIGLKRESPTFRLPSESPQRIRKLNFSQGSGRDVLHAAHLLLLLSLAAARKCACILLVHAYQACIGASVYAQAIIPDDSLNSA